MSRPRSERGLRPQRHAAAGFTLIETLAVVALLALVMALGAVHLSGATRRARIDTALHTLAQADAVARSLAVSGDPTTLRLEADGRDVVVFDRQSASVALRRSLAFGLSASFGNLNNASLADLEFDAAGRCVDHDRILIDEGQVVSVVRVSGITGWAETVGGAR